MSSIHAYAEAVSATLDADIAALVRTALDEDVGAGDVTTLATVTAEARAGALITQKAPGAIYGLDAAEATFALLDPDAALRAAGGRGGVARAGRAGAVDLGGARARCSPASALR